MFGFFFKKNRNIFLNFPIFQNLSKICFIEKINVFGNVCIVFFNRISFITLASGIVELLLCHPGAANVPTENPKIHKFKILDIFWGTFSLRFAKTIFFKIIYHPQPMQVASRNSLYGYATRETKNPPKIPIWGYKLSGDSLTTFGTTWIIPMSGGTNSWHSSRTNWLSIDWFAILMTMVNLVFHFIRFVLMASVCLHVAQGAADQDGLPTVSPHDATPSTVLREVVDQYKLFQQVHENFKAIRVVIKLYPGWQQISSSPLKPNLGTLNKIWRKPLGTPPALFTAT